jgi:hypothetical protein
MQKPCYDTFAGINVYNMLIIIIIITSKANYRNAYAKQYSVYWTLQLLYLYRRPFCIIINQARYLVRHLHTKLIRNWIFYVFNYRNVLFQIIKCWDYNIIYDTEPVYFLSLCDPLHIYVELSIIGVTKCPFIHIIRQFI